MRSKLFSFLFLLTFFSGYSQLTGIQWSSIDSFPGGGRFGMYGFTLGHKAFAGLGLTQSNTTPSDWYEYDTMTKVWTAKNNFPGVGRWTGVSFQIGGLGYIVCGSTHNSVALTSELWQYNPSTDLWIQKATMPGTARQTCAGFALDNYGYVGTGFIGGGTVLKDMWRYDPDADAWTQMSDFPGTARDGAITFSIDTTAYMGMGCAVNGNSFFNDMYKYYPSNDTWVPISNFPGVSLNNTSAVDYGGYGYLVSGIHNSQASGVFTVQSVHQYNPLNDTWSIVLDSFPGPGTGYGVGFNLDGDIYYGNGTLDGTVANCTPYFWKTSPLPSREPSGINTVTANSCPAFFPNPFTDAVYVSNAGPQLAFSMRVFDMTGRMVADGLTILDNGRINYDMSGLETGAYIMESTNAKTNSVNRIKLIKQ